MKEWRVAEAHDRLLVVACEPLAQIRNVNPVEYPCASNVLGYLDAGGQVIFGEGSGSLPGPEAADCENIAAEILKILGHVRGSPDAGTGDHEDSGEYDGGLGDIDL